MPLPLQCVAMFIWDMTLCSRRNEYETSEEQIVSFVREFDHLCWIVLGAVFWGLHYGEISIKLEGGRVAVFGGRRPVFI